MPDSAPVASKSRRLEPASEIAPTTARRLPLAAATFLLAALIGFGFDVQQSPERFAAAGIIFVVDLALCALTTLLALLAPRWGRVVLSFSAPLLPVSLGVYGALVGASPNMCVIALCLYLAGTVLLLAGPVVQLLIVLGTAVAYACVTSTSTLALAITNDLAVLTGIAGLSVLAAFWQQRRHVPAGSQQEALVRMQAEHAHATTLLSAVAALGGAVRDPSRLARVAADQICVLLDADWAVFWQRDHSGTFRAAAVSGLPAAIAAAIKIHELATDKIAVLYERLERQKALTLTEREAQRFLPLDAVAPILKHGVVATVQQHQGVGAILLAGFATRSRRMTAEAETLLARFAEQVATALGTAHLIEDALSANRAKSEFIATMSHEVRTPINVVMGYADLLIEGAFGSPTQDQLDVLNRVRHQTAQLLDLVQPMLDLTRLEARQTAIVREPLRVAELIENLQLAIPASWCKPGVVLSWCAPIGPDVVMHTDRTKVEMIVRNLIHNALKYTDRGEVRVDIDATTPGYVHIIVRDTGTGIATHDLPILFEMFGQAASELPRDGGVGLGLYIVKRLTDVLGGRVSVESVRGTGSTFTVSLPLEAPAEVR
jgi:signal transduction histidine kinase